MSATRARAEALLRRMVEIPSPSGDEAAVAAHLVRILPEFGLQTHVDDVGNVIGRRGDPAAPMIVLVGHMDTVPSPVPVRQEGTILYGRGTVDAKGPLATMIAAAATADVGDVQIVVAGVVEEETYGRGATHLAQTLRPDAGIVGEPNGWAGVGIGYMGRVMLRYDASRASVHTASPQQKATEAAVEFWNGLTRYCDGVAGGAGVFDRPHPTLLEMRGTLEEATLTGSVRTPPGFDVDAFERALLAGTDEADVLTISDRTPAVRVDHRGPVVRALCAAIRSRGERPRLKLKTGTADLNIVEPVWQVPMAVYGPGDSALDHTDHEHIDLVEYGGAIDVLREALELLARELVADRRAARDEPVGALG